MAQGRQPELESDSGSFIHKQFCCPSGMSSWEEGKGEVNGGIVVYTTFDPLQVHPHEADTAIPFFNGEQASPRSVTKSG